VTTLRILHSSDLHARAEAEDDQRLIIQALISDAAARSQERAFDLAVVSGDLAFSGTDGDFDLARRMLLEPLADALDLPLAQVVVVPGNHDVNRDRINRFLERGYSDLLIDRAAVNGLLSEPVELAAATERLTEWNRFHVELYEDDPPEQIAPLAFLHRFDFDGLRVGVAALNSAWRARGGDEDRRRLLLGDKQVSPALAGLADCDVPIVVLHHPLDWLSRFDADDVRGQLARGAVLVLSGHEHVPDPTFEAGAHGQALFSRAGCLYESEEYFNGYSIVDIDLNSRTVAVSLRTWWRERRVFDQATAVAAEGRITLTWPQAATGASIGPALSTVLSSLAQRAQEVSVVADRLRRPTDAELDELLVPPRFWPLPYNEIQAAGGLKMDSNRSPPTLSYRSQRAGD